MDGLVAELLEGARAEMAVVAEHGGAVEAVDYMKAALVDSHRERLRRIESGEQVVVGLNRFTETEPSPLHAGRRRRHPHGRPGGRGPAARGGRRAGAPSATRPPWTPRWPRSPASPAPRTRTSCPRRSPPPARARRPASGRARCATCSASTARRPASARPPRPSAPATTSSRRCATRSSASARRSGAGSRSSSASRASTGTPTAPSRSPCARATPAWTSSTRASA